MGRDRRRADKERMKRKARKVYPHDPDAKLADHLASCSCAMCGNPRKWNREATRKEQVAARRAAEEVEEQQEFDEARKWASHSDW